MASNKNFIYFFIGLAVLALIFLAITSLFVTVAWREKFFSEGITTQSARNETQKVFDDPLITVVPEEQQSTEQKTKVFVSSLDPIDGERTAKVFIILYGNLLDTDMQNTLSLVDDLRQTYAKENVAIIWKDYTTSATEEFASIVGHCANEQGKFWEHATTMKDRSGDERVDFLTLATSVGANEDILNECIDTDGFSAVVQQSSYAGQALGVNNGHTLFINDRMYSDPLPLDQIKKSIDEILASF